MYSKNEKITLRQLKRLVVFDLLGVLFLIVPYVITSGVGYDGLGAFLIGALLLFVYLLIFTFYLKQIDGPYLTYSKTVIGKFLTTIFCILYLIKFFFTIVMITKLFIAVINNTILTEYSTLSIGLPFIAAAGYMAYKGIEVRARYAEVMYYIVLVPIVVLSLFTLKEIDLANLTPIFTTDSYKVFNAGFLFFLLFNLLELLLFIKPYIKSKKPKSSVVTGIFSYTLRGLICIFLLSILVFSLTVGLLGEKASAESLWSTVAILQLAQFPWSLLNRQDSILIALWLLSTISILSGLLYYMSHITKHIFGKRSQNCILPIIIILVYLAAITPMDINLCYKYFTNYMIYIGLPQSIILPLIPILVRKMKPVSRSAGKTAIITLIFLIMPLWLQSCANQVEIEERDFVQVFGVDYNNGQFMAYYALPDLAAVSEQPSSDSEKLLRIFQGNNLYEIEEQYKLCSEKKLDYRHLKAIVLGENLVKNKERFQQFINYCEKHYEVSKNTLVFLSNSSLWTVMDYNKKIPDGIGNYLIRLHDNNLSIRSKGKTTLGTLVNDRNNSDMTIHVPIVTLQMNGLVINGEGIVENSKLVATLDEEDSKYAGILQGYIGNCRLFLQNSTNDASDHSLVVQVGELRNNKNLTLLNGIPYLKIKIEGQGILEQGVEETLQYTTTERVKAYHALEKQINIQIKKRMEDQIRQILGEKNIDYLNTLRMSRYLNRNIYNFYKTRQSNFIEDLKVEVSFELTLNP